MSLLDLIVILVIIVASHFVAIPFGIVAFTVGALIVERLIKGERL